MYLVKKNTRKDKYTVHTHYLPILYIHTHTQKRMYEVLKYEKGPSPEKVKVPSKSLCFVFIKHKKGVQSSRKISTMETFPKIQKV